jgi:hypothetical protein
VYDIVRVYGYMPASGLGLLDLQFADMDEMRNDCLLDNGRIKGII